MINYITTIIQYSACYGQYDLALRELRNVLESAFLFYRADYDINLRVKIFLSKIQQYHLNYF